MSAPPEVQRILDNCAQLLSAARTIAAEVDSGVRPPEHMKFADRYTALAADAIRDLELLAQESGRVWPKRNGMHRHG